MHRILSRPCWVFDLDGTLTIPVHDFAAIRKELGMSEADPDILQYLSNLPVEEASVKHSRLIEIEYALADRTGASHGAINLLDQLASRGVSLGILTRNTREIALHTLKKIGLGDYFPSEAILGRDEAAPKPHPEGITRLIETWQSSPEQTVMVGDYLFDLQTGRAAGTATIHVDGTGTFRWPELADISVTSLEELALSVALYRC